MIPQAASPEHHTPGDKNSRDLFLTVLETGKPTVKVPAESVSWFVDGCLLAMSSSAGKQGHLSLYRTMKYHS